MPAEEREFSGAELASRWLTVDQVLGRRGRWGWAAVDSAGEYFAAESDADAGAAGAAGGERPVDGGPDDGLPDGDRSGGDSPGPEVAAANGAYIAPDVIAAIGERPVPDLVAADTDLASRWFTADRTLGEFAGRTVLLPFPAVAELATWPERLLWGHSRTEDFCEWLDPGRTIPGDETVARIWGRIVVAAQRTGGTPPANAAWIAAGCLSYGLPLATLNKRRYQPFADRYGLQLI